MIGRFDVDQCQAKKDDFQFPCTLANNGITIPTHFLPDTGASGYIYVNKNLALDFAKRTNTPLEPIPPRPVRGYNLQPSEPISLRLQTTLTMESRSFPNTYLYIIEGLACDLIIGRKWLAQHKVLLDVAGLRIIWPEDDKRMEPQPQTALAREPVHQISMINAAAYRMSARNNQNECFVATLWEVDRILYQREHSLEDPLEETEAEMLKRTVPEEYYDLVDVFSKTKADALPPHRDSDHKIRLTQPNNLTLSPLYRQTTKELQALKKFIDENLNRGWIAPSNAPFAAPILFVKKANGDLRLCVDYRKLNEISVKDGYPLPRIDEILSQMSKAKVFTKLDLRSAFNAIRMDPDSEELTAFQTCYGQFKSLVLPFGLSGGPGTYQRFINSLLMKNLGNFCTAYLDDIIIYSTDPLEHTSQVRWVLNKLKEAGLSVDIKKCDFRVTRIKYLGFYVSTEGLEVDPEKVQDVLNWARPTSVKGVRGFLGFCGFYRKFIRNYGRIARPLDRLTQKNRVFEWTPECQEAFETLRRAVTEAPVLHYFHTNRSTKVETDSSDGVTGGILSQLDPVTGNWHPLAFFSKTMNPAECNYEIHDKEMLAILQAFQQWRVELQSVEEPVKVYSDHQSLEVFMRSKKLTARQARWAEYLSQFNFQLEYRTGKANGQADALTRRDGDLQSQRERMEANRIGTLLKPDMLSAAVRTEMLAPLVEEINPQLELTLQVLQANRTAPEIEEQRTLARTETNGIWTLTDGLLFRANKLVVPDAMVDDAPLKTLLIKEAHDQISTSHPGIRKTKELLSQRYYWKGLPQDIERYIRNCSICRRSHVPRDKTPGLLQPLPVPERPWQHLTMDFKSFPKSKKGHDAILVFMCRLSKKSTTIPCSQTADARDLARMFLERIYPYYGPPDSIVSDRGPQFISDFWTEVCSILGIKMKLSTADHPQTDGQTENMNQYIDQRLRPFVNFYQDNWDELIPMVDFAQAALVQESVGQTPFFTILGFEPRTSFDWKEIPADIPATARWNRQEAQVWTRRLHQAWEDAKSSMLLAQERQKVQANKRRREVDFGVGDMVYVNTKSWRSSRPSRKLGDQMSGPYKILEKRGQAFKLDLPMEIKVHPYFNPEKLRKAANDPLPGQINTPPTPETIEGNLEWELEKILSVRKVYGLLRYRVKWRGLDTDLDEYSPEDLKNSPLALKAFHDEYPALPGPPKNLRYWLDCALEDKVAEDRLDDNEED